jgi:hypothetical protein
MLTTLGLFFVGLILWRVATALRRLPHWHPRRRR